MKKLLIVTGLIFVGLAYILGEHVGLNRQCTTIDLHSDYTFFCDGRKIQGPDYHKATVQSWEFHSSN